MVFETAFESIAKQMTFLDLTDVESKSKVFPSKGPSFETLFFFFFNIYAYKHQGNLWRF